MIVSKTRTSFYRRLYVAWLIHSQQATSIPQLMQLTGMPRRTAQDTLNALAELDIQCTFEQSPDAANNIGHYRISDWGPIQLAWIEAHLAQVKAVLGYP